MKISGESQPMNYVKNNYDLSIYLITCWWMPAKIMDSIILFTLYP